MAQSPIGYAHLVATFGLPARALTLMCCIDTLARQRRETVRAGQTCHIFESSYLKGDTLIAHLEFALRYEGPNLEVLALLFAQRGKAEIEAWLAATPTGRYARQAGFLYEFLTARTLDVSDVPAKTRYLPLLDPEKYLTGPHIRNAKFGLIVNLLGDPTFCPTVRNTPYIIEQRGKNLKALAPATPAAIT